MKNIPIFHAAGSQLTPENASNLSCSRARVGENDFANECAEDLNNELVFLNSVIDHDCHFDVEILTLTCRLITRHIAGFIVWKLEAKLACSLH